MKYLGGRLTLIYLFIYCLTLAQQPPGPPSKEERIKQVSEKMEKELKINANQKQKIKSAYMEFFTKMDALREKDKNQMPVPPPPPPPPGSKEQVDKLSNQRDVQIKQILSAAQYAKYQQLEKTLHPPKPQDLHHDKPPAPRPTH